MACVSGAALIPAVHPTTKPRFAPFALALLCAACAGTIEPPDFNGSLLPTPGGSPGSGALTGHAGDAGSLPDGGLATLDAGTPKSDAGQPVVDSGTPPVLPPPSPTTCMKILPLGDSITLGVNGGYRNGVYTGLRDAGCGVDLVGSQKDQYTEVADKDHEGHPGFTIGDISASVDSWVTSANPNIVLLMVGTNDVAWWCAKTAQEVATEHGKLIDKILAKQPAAWVIVGSIAPLTSQIIAPNNVDRAQLAKDLNAAILAQVNARITAGKHVRFADINSVLTVSDLYDGVHPTRAAHDKVAAQWLKALQATFTCSGTPTCG